MGRYIYFWRGDYIAYIVKHNNCHCLSKALCCSENIVKPIMEVFVSTIHFMRVEN